MMNVVIAIGDREINVSRTKLMSQSYIFRRFLESQMDPQLPVRLKMPDVHYDDIFLFAQAVDGIELNLNDNLDMKLRLLKTADRFQAFTLVDELESSILYHDINRFNVIHALKVAHHVGLDRVKTMALDHFADKDLNEGERLSDFTGMDSLPFELTCLITNYLLAKLREKRESGDMSSDF